MAQPRDAKLKGVIKLAPGAKVQVNGLKNQTELNGLVGTLLSFDAVKMRWGVDLPDGKQIALKMGNLLPISTEISPAAVSASTLPISAEISPAAVSASTDSGPEVKAEALEEQQQLDCEEDRDAHTLVETVSSSASAETCSLPSSAVGDSSVSGSTSVAENTPPVLLEENSTEGFAVDGKLDDEEWPVLPTSAATAAKMRSGCWFDGGSAAKRFTEQLRANDPELRSICLVPPKRFNDDDAMEICDALEVNSFCDEMLASGHPLSTTSCERLATMLRVNKTLRTLSVGNSTLGDQACLLFEGLAANTSLTALDLEHKGLTAEAFRALAQALVARQRIEAAPVTSLKLSRNVGLCDAIAELATIDVTAPEKLLLSDCGLVGARHAKSIGCWAARGVQELDLRDNNAFGSEGVEFLLSAMAPAQALRTLRLDGCAIGDDGLEAIAEAISHRGLALEELYVERCEITLAGCELLAQACRGRRLATLSVRANVIGDEGCALLAQCAERLDLSSTSLSGQVLSVLGEQALVSLELFSNPSLGPSVSTWCAGLDSAQWQRLENLDLGGCGMNDEGFLCVINALLERPTLMPSLSCLSLGSNDVTEDDDKCSLVERLCEARGGRLSVAWQNS